MRVSVCVFASMLCCQYLLRFGNKHNNIITITK